MSQHTIDEPLFEAARNGDIDRVTALLDLGVDVNGRENGDNTYAMHWAAAAGHVDVVRRLADAGGDVIGHGDDHELEVIGWATCWDGCDDATHRSVAEFLVSRGARHHIFSAIAMSLADEVRRIVAADPSALSKTMSHNEDFQRPLHFTVRKNLPRMVALLVELGADPLGTDASGYPAAVYATTPDVDRSVMELLRAQGKMDVVAALAVEDRDAAARLLSDAGKSAGALHIMAKRNDVAAVKWLLDHGMNPNIRWSHWNAEVTPLHLAALHGHADVVRLLLEGGIDPTIHDSMHDSDAMGWAEHSGRLEIVAMLNEHGK